MQGSMKAVALAAVALTLATAALVYAGTAVAAPTGCVSSLTFLNSPGFDRYQKYGTAATAAGEAELWRESLYQAILAENAVRSLPVACDGTYRFWRTGLIQSASHFTKSMRAQLAGNTTNALWHMKRSLYWIKRVNATT